MQQNISQDGQCETDERFMRRALELALRGSGRVNPNPLVGAVIVKDGRIIGEGWHTAFGQAHAERHALSRCTQDPRGATLYVTLEPCCHTGKQPPCTEAIIEAGISRVVMGAPDPNPKVAGGGIAQLEAAGIEVVQGILVGECQEQNHAFLRYIQTGRPYVVLKYAMTLDGKIATRTGKSKWITGPAARRRVHEDRQRYAAIMVGVNTIIKDDPQLTCRLGEFDEGPAVETAARGSFEDKLEAELDADEAALERGEQAAQGEQADGQAAQSAQAPAAQDDFTVEPSNPIRIVCDTHLRCPLDAQVVRTASEVPTYIATCERDAAKQMPYREREVELIVVPEADGHVDLDELFAKLGAMGIDSVIVEGGAELNWSALAFESVQRVQAYIAPKIFGGAKAPGPVMGFGVAAPDYAIQLSEPCITRLGDDLLLECEVL